MTTQRSAVDARRSTRTRTAPTWSSRQETTVAQVSSSSSRPVFRLRMKARVPVSRPPPTGSDAVEVAEGAIRPRRRTTCVRTTTVRRDARLAGVCRREMMRPVSSSTDRAAYAPPRRNCRAPRARGRQAVAPLAAAALRQRDERDSDGGGLDHRRRRRRPAPRAPAAVRALGLWAVGGAPRQSARSERPPLARRKERPPITAAAATAYGMTTNSGPQPFTGDTSPGHAVGRTSNCHKVP